MERRSRISHWMRFCWGLFCYPLYWVPLVLLAFLLSLLAYPLSPFINRSDLFHWYTHKAFRFGIFQYLPCIRGQRILSFESRELLQHEGGAIIIGNHRSWIDGALIIAEVQGTTPILKVSYTTHWFYRFWIQWFQSIPVDPSSQAKLHKLRTTARDYLKAGKKLLIFPEGSRSRTNEMLPFKRLAFQLAVDYQVPIIPVLQSSDTPFMAKEGMPTFFPNREVYLKVKVLQPTLPHKGETVNAFTDRMESLMKDELRKLDKSHR